MLAEIMNAAVEGLLGTRQARRDTLRAIEESVQGSVAGWREARRTEQARLEETRRVLMKSLVAGRAALKGEVAALCEEAASALGEANQARAAGARALRSRLQSQVREEKEEAQSLRQRARQQLAIQSKQRAANSSSLHRELQASRDRVQQEGSAAVGRARDFMKDTSVNRAEKTEELRRNLDDAAGELRDAVNRVRSTLVADLSQARAEWRRTVSPAEPTMAPAPLEVAESSPVETGAQAVSPEVSEELGKKIFKYLADHPDGVRLRELEEQLKAGRFQVARALRTLTDEGKVRKEDMLYFAQ